MGWWQGLASGTGKDVDPDVVQELKKGGKAAAGIEVGVGLRYKALQDQLIVSLLSDFQEPWRFRKQDGIPIRCYRRSRSVVS
jgi:hypothetical protein